MGCGLLPKNGGKLFITGNEPKVAIELFDHAEGVLQYTPAKDTGIATGAIQGVRTVW